MKTNILIFIALCVMVGCKKTESGTDTKYIRANIDKMDNISIFDIFDKIEVIPLETTDKSLIGGISKVIVHNDVYYVLDP
ncbi:MAG: 6-bladed beta-propeller, partial [Tannerella sp.]|nr:6-bladed beta-propeller [Tannerella sp.]